MELNFSKEEQCFRISLHHDAQGNLESGSEWKFIQIYRPTIMQLKLFDDNKTNLAWE